MTDNEIPNVKELLEYKVKAHCELCDLKELDCCHVCMYTAIKQFIELFNRLEAENERLTHITRNLIGEIKAEAMTEFAEELKEKSFKTYDWRGMVKVVDIDNLLKEIVGEDNA